MKSAAGFALVIMSLLLVAVGYVLACAFYHFAKH